MGIEQVIVIVHVLIALAIIGLILLQQGKGAEMGASFGAGSSQTVFGGAGGGSVLTKATAVLAAAFFVTSFALAIVAKGQAGDNAVITVPEPVVVEGAWSDSPDEAVDEIPDGEEGMSSGSDSEIPGVD